MTVYFDFYDRESQHEAGAIQCEKGSVTFDKLVTAGYSFVEHPRSGHYTNYVDTPGEFQKIVASVGALSFGDEDDDDDDKDEDEDEDDDDDDICPVCGESEHGDCECTDEELEEGRAIW